MPISPVIRPKSIDEDKDGQLVGFPFVIFLLWYLLEPAFGELLGLHNSILIVYSRLNKHAQDMALILTSLGKVCYVGGAALRVKSSR